MSAARALALALALASLSPARAAEPVTPQARRLAATLDSLDVESRWLPGARVNWESGLPNGRPITQPGRHTHCSAFVAAAASRLGVYILRPPEHGQTLLANAQADWLASEGAAQGWREVAGAAEAQALANRGLLVVASYKNRRPDRAGHIAIVRPSDKSDRAIAEEGPQVTQAGTINAASVSLRVGFSHSPSALRYDLVRYFAHAIAP